MKRTLVIGLIVGLILAACSANTPPTRSDNVTPAPLPATTLQPTQPADIVRSPEPSTSAPDTPQPVKSFLPDPTVGLDQLSSYQLTLTITFKGQRDGQAWEWKDLDTHRFSRQPAAQFTTLTMRGENDQSIPIMYGNLDGAHYFQKGAEACQVSWGEQAPNSEGVNPAAWLPPLATVKEVGQETVNGVSSRHYAIAEASNGLQTTGEVWLAEPGGYVVKYDLTLQAGEQFFGKGIEGTQTFHYELSEINSLQEVSLPVGCPAVLTEIPAMPDALDLVRRPGSMAFTTPSDLKSIQSFYQDKLKALGWTLLAQHTDNARQPVLVFTRHDGEESALVSLQQETNKVWVAIQLSKSAAASGATPARP